jgi:hypothetical protein
MIKSLIQWRRTIRRPWWLLRTLSKLRKMMLLHTADTSRIPLYHDEEERGDELLTILRTPIPQRLYRAHACKLASIPDLQRMKVTTTTILILQCSSEKRNHNAEVFLIVSFLV